MSSSDPGRKAAAEVLARALAADPIYQYFLPDEPTRSRDMVHLMQAMLELNGGDGQLQVAGNPPVGAAILESPGRAGVPPRVLFRAVLRFGSKFTFRSVWRMISILFEFERLRPKHRHWYVMALGVEPALQRRGTGRALLQVIHERAAADRCPVYLETNNERNVPYYQQFGYVVVKSFRCARGRGPMTWCMQRPASGDA